MWTCDTIARVAFAAGLSAFGTPALADVVISSSATSNMSCMSGVCTPTSPNAVLNVGDLQTMLASGSVTIQGFVEPVDIDVQAAFSWSSSTSLTLDSYHSVNVAQPVAVTGNGGLTIATNDGGSGGWFTFAPNANVEFLNLSSALSINGAAYTLVGNIATLASDISANPSGNFALAGDYNAAPDGTYSKAPVSTNFLGNFQGLGNAISNLTISGGGSGAHLGLFALAMTNSTISNVLVGSAKIIAKGDGAEAGILAAASEGTMFGDHTSGSVTVGKSGFGGGLSSGGTTIVASSSSANVSGGDGSSVGGLVAQAGTVTECFATGAVKVKAPSNGGAAGGLAVDVLALSDSYATGSIQGSGSDTIIGGLLSQSGNNATVAESYSSGKVSGSVKDAGGFVGFVFSISASNSYWDTQTSGSQNASGNEHSVPGIAGLTTKKLKSGLPSGFDPTIWAHSKTINKGFPYLIANPPQ